MAWFHWCGGLLLFAIACMIGATVVEAFRQGDKPLTKEDRLDAAENRRRRKRDR